MSEVISLASLMYFLEMSINHNALGDKVWLESQDEATQKEWQYDAQQVIKLTERNRE